ncbi:MAG: beta-lactamase family protein [Nitrospirae bacterium]|nr:beta-lactamase family protein [Nitrospirota bacterium]NTW65091.1 beta-lactamase family protein [Nitrospirota bacterium]
MQQKMRISIMLVTAGLFCAASGCAGPFRSLTPEMVRTDLEDVRARYFVPSLGVAEVTLDEIVSFGPVGKARIDGGLPVTADSLYQLGSCTKAMTATALIKLMQDGTLSWDTRLLDVFPEYAETANPEYRDVTLADIASHQAGFPPAGDQSTWVRLRTYQGSRTQYLDEVLQQPSWIRRGRYLYSNNGYAALGAVIERRTGLSYAEAMNMLLFDPLGVRAYYVFPKDIGPDQPWGNTANWGAAAPARAVDQSIPEVLGPAGIVTMNLRDYGRFLQLHLRGLLGRDDAGYTPEMINQLHRTRVRTRGPFEQAYASGWMVEKVNGETIHWHNGSAGNFMVYMAINPGRKKGVVVVTNVGSSQGVRVCWDIIERVLTGGRAEKE